MAEINKSILVIDTPLRCYDCPSYKGSIRGEMCGVAGNTLTTSELFDTTKKPDWCPLRPVPKKIDVPDWDDNIKAKNKNAEEVGIYMYDRGHYRGYNICISNILGE